MALCGFSIWRGVNSLFSSIFQIWKPSCRRSIFFTEMPVALCSDKIQRCDTCQKMLHAMEHLLICVKFLYLIWTQSYNCFRENCWLAALCYSCSVQLTSQHMQVSWQSADQMWCRWFFCMFWLFFRSFMDSKHYGALWTLWQGPWKNQLGVKTVKKVDLLPTWVFLGCFFNSFSDFK